MKVLNGEQLSKHRWRLHTLPTSRSHFLGNRLFNLVIQTTYLGMGLGHSHPPFSSIIHFKIIFTLQNVTYFIKTESHWNMFTDYLLLMNGLSSDIMSQTKFKVCRHIFTFQNWLFLRFLAYILLTWGIRYRLAILIEIYPLFIVDVVNFFTFSTSDLKPRNQFQANTTQPIVL